MWGSRKNAGAGGGRVPPAGLTPRRPGPGSARGRGSPRHRAVPGVDPHCPRAGRDSLLSRVLMCFAKGLWRFCPLARRHNWNCHVLSSRAAAHPVQGVWSYESMSIWRTSSATLVTCVKYASVCVSPGGRRPGGGTSHSHAWPGYDIHCESPGVPDPLPPPRASAIPTFNVCMCMSMCTRRVYSVFNFPGHHYFIPGLMTGLRLSSFTMAEIGEGSLSPRGTKEAPAAGWMRRAGPQGCAPLFSSAITYSARRALAAGIRRSTCSAAEALSIYLSIYLSRPSIS